MRQSILIPTISTICFLISCNHVVEPIPAKPAIKGVDYAFSWAYEKSTGNITIKLQNFLSEPLCFDDSCWPDQNDEMHFGLEALSVIVDGVSYSFEDTNLGYGAGRYGPHLPENGELSAKINLSQFNIPTTSELPDVSQLTYNNGLGYCD